MFKIGDKVRCVDTGGYLTIRTNKIYRVQQTTETSVALVNDFGTISYYEDDIFELVTEKENAVQTETKQPHKDRDLIIAWANGAAIEGQCPFTGEWYDWEPDWSSDDKLRIKLVPKPDQSRTMFVELHPKLDNAYNKPNLKLTFDGETEKLKAVEIISI